ncbi:MAG: glycosyltransferase [Methylobacteriaceae bacterium]|jgi:glycosyltransferase involved in cell wall biosynthesis|nr:glycosyltransferase [Methylobacteriaceae bacterium]
MRKISIIIATLNAASTLERCLQSIFDQHYPDLEVLVEDGLSTDATLDMVGRFADNGLPILARSRKDKGLYDALNNGVARATGDLINILGADDELMPGALKTVDHTASGTQAEILAGYALCAGDGWQAVQKTAPFEPHAILMHAPFCHNAMFASPGAYQRVGPYDISLKLSADMRWVHKAILAGEKFRAIDDVIVKFRIGGMSSDPETVIHEAVVCIIQAFPELGFDEAKHLLFMAKGWLPVDNRCTDILKAHSDNAFLCDAIEKAAAYAPFGPQRAIDEAMNGMPHLHRLPHRIGRRLRGYIPWLS